MMGRLDPLIEISRYYGDNPAFVIAGGGNTSFKNSDTIWVKASGIPLAGIDEKGFVSLDRKRLSRIESAIYSDDPVKREEEVKEEMTQAILEPLNLRPSVETSLHNLIGYTYVVHTHPTLVNGLMCANNVEAEVEQRFGERALLVEYTDPGYILFKKVQERIAAYRKRYGKESQIIFLQNHGVFVGANTLEEIKKLYAEIDLKLGRGKNLSLPSAESSTFESEVNASIASYFASRSLQTLSVNGALIDHFTSGKSRLPLISKPFSPDIIVYCKSSYLFLEAKVKANDIKGLIEEFEEKHGYYPKVIIQENGGLTLVEESERSLQTVKEVFLDLMKISYLSEQFGGPHFMTPDQIRFIDNWEVEHYRRKVAKGE